MGHQGQGVVEAQVSHLVTVDTTATEVDKPDHHSLAPPHNATAALCFLYARSVEYMLKH